MSGQGNSGAVAIGRKRPFIKDGVAANAQELLVGLLSGDSLSCLALPNDPDNRMHGARGRCDRFNLETRIRARY